MKLQLGSKPSARTHIRDCLPAAQKSVAGNAGAGGLAERFGLAVATDETLTLMSFDLLAHRLACPN